MLLRIISTAFLLAAPWSLLQASTYSNANRKTILALDETWSRLPHTTGQYTTMMGGRLLNGFITIDHAEGAVGSYYYRGQFHDSTEGAGPQLECSGEILIRRNNNFEMGRRKAIEVKWLNMEGWGCSVPSGGAIQLALQESLPFALADGEFKSSNANTMRSETNGDVTWPAWSVISKDGEVNCRDQTLGSILYTYSKQETILAETRGGNAFVSKGGQSWMRTRRGCYVRASNLYVSPLSLPENFVQ